MILKVRFRNTVRIDQAHLCYITSYLGGKIVQKCHERINCLHVHKPCNLEMFRIDSIILNSLFEVV